MEGQVVQLRPLTYATINDACRSEFCHYKAFLAGDNEEKYRCTICGNITWPGDSPKESSLDDAIREALEAKRENRPVRKKRHLKLKFKL